MSGGILTGGGWRAEAWRVAIKDLMLAGQQLRSTMFNLTASVLTNAAGQALGAVISKFKTQKNVGFSTFSKMYHSHVVPITDYSSGIWGY